MPKAIDVNGLEVKRGDVVAPINGDFKGRVCDVRSEDGLAFICIRPAHRPYSRGVWYPCEHVQRLAAGRIRSKPAAGPRSKAG